MQVSPSTWQFSSVKLRDVESQLRKHNAIAAFTDAVQNSFPTPSMQKQTQAWNQEFLDIPVWFIEVKCIAGKAKPPEENVSKLSN